jgi:hypothetical protein
MKTDKIVIAIVILAVIGIGYYAISHIIQINKTIAATK